MAEVTVRVETEIHPTEAEDKVKTAVSNMFGKMDVQIESLSVGCLLVGVARCRDTLENFRAVLRRDRVRAAARKLLYSSIRGCRISFYLNKQVAFTGHVSFSEETGECPLGPIKVVIESDSPREIVDWLAPRPTET